MANQLFNLDLSEGADDFQQTATEPGLAMLDATGANYATLCRWVGDYAAEPVWLGPERATVFIRHEGERVTEHAAAPVSASDLEKGLKEDWEELQNKLRKARPETASEQTLQRVATKALKNIAADPEANDVSCQLFKYRANGRPWKLVWCWGYQRVDTDPARGTVCRNKDCQHLFAHRQGQKAICPVCQKLTTPVGRRGALAGARGRRMAGGLLALAVILLLLLMFSGGAISVAPTAWTGPYGSNVEMKVSRTRFFFFQSDITDNVIFISNDPRVMDVESNVARARGIGDTTVTARYGDQSADLKVQVTAAKPTVAISLVPSEANLMIGSTHKIVVTGETEDGNEIDITDQATLLVDDSDIAMLHDGVIEGVKAGKTKLVATYRESAFSEEVRAELEVDVSDVKLKSLGVSVAPGVLKQAQYGAWTVTGVGENGETYGFARSTLLDASVAPADLADIEDQRVRAIKSGEGKLVAAIGELKGEGGFTVTGEGLYGPGFFAISPKEVNLSIYEYFQVNLLTNDIRTVVGVSSDPRIVEVLDNEHLVARGPGEAIVTYKQGDKVETLKVRVSGVEYERIWVENERVVMRPGQRRLVRIYAQKPDGGQIEIAPSNVIWESQPLAEYVGFDRRTGYLSAIAPTPHSQRLTARIGNHLVTEIAVDVVGSGGLLAQGGSTLLAVDNGFVAHPPVSIHDINAGRYVGRGIVFRGDGLTVSDGLANDHILMRSGLRPGMSIVGVNGSEFRGWDQDRIRSYFLENPLSRDDVLTVRGLDGASTQIALGENGQLIEPVKIANASYHADGGMIFAKLRLMVAEAGEYRILPPGSAGDEAWISTPAGLSPSITTKPFAKPVDRAFELIVERRIGEETKRFSKNLKLPDDSLIQ
jgi:hypothetical protein